MEPNTKKATWLDKAACLIRGHRWKQVWYDKLLEDVEDRMGWGRQAKIIQECECCGKTRMVRRPVRVVSKLKRMMRSWL